MADQLTPQERAALDQAAAALGDVVGLFAEIATDPATGEPTAVRVEHFHEVFDQDPVLHARMRRIHRDGGELDPRLAQAVQQRLAEPLEPSLDVSDTIDG